MPRTPALPAPDFLASLLETYAVNDRMNQIIIERLDPHVWHAKPPGKVRTIAAVFAHMHHARRKWLRLSAPHIKPAAELDPRHCTPRQAQRALAQSAKGCSQMLADALSGQGRITHFHRDGWSRRWPCGASMFAYMVMHDVHHRGQICMLAHQLGYAIKAGHEIWMWERLWKQCGFTAPH